MNNTFSELYNEFLTYVEKNDEQGARKFLVDNLLKFPKDVQEKITVAFFEEALQKNTEGVKEITEMQEESLEAIKQIDKAKKILGENAKIEKIKSDLFK